ncbi:ExbD/TolR family protein [Aestuariispira insulae]|nr:biopolymer transporter ExbD [Aestuariispira insulae]
MRLNDHHGEDDISISLTPLIDVVFILLIFFMLASSFLDWNQITIRGGSNAPAATASNDQQIAILAIRADHSLLLDEVPVGKPDLPGRLEALQRSEKPLRILVQVADGVAMQQTLDLLLMLRQAGVEDYALVDMP